jgi:pimeloyl-ACP methyl ester carboxylesterase
MLENKKTIDDFFETSDGVRLHYRVAGEGYPLVFLAGLTCNIATYADNFAVFEKHFRVYSFDYRAHGKSEVPQYGIHIERFAKDLEEFLAQMGLEECYLAAHSMGNAITWCYMSLFGQKKIKKYILIDESPCLIADEAWTEEECDTYMGKFRKENIWDISGFGQPSDWENPQQREALIRLYRDHIMRDWRQEIRQIQVPTLLLMGANSHFSSPLLWNWLKENISDSKLVTISKEDGGTHDMFRDGPEIFNRIVLEYLGVAQ